MLFTISSISRTLFLVKSYYLINNHIEVTVLNQGQVTKQTAVIHISEIKQRFFLQISKAAIFIKSSSRSLYFFFSSNRRCKINTGVAK